MNIWPKILKSFISLTTIDFFFETSQLKLDCYSEFHAYGRNEVRTLFARRRERRDLCVDQDSTRHQGNITLLAVQQVQGCRIYGCIENNQNMYSLVTCDCMYSLVTCDLSAEKMSL